MKGVKRKNPYALLKNILNGLNHGVFPVFCIEVYFFRRNRYERSQEMGINIHRVFSYEPPVYVFFCSRSEIYFNSHNTK